MQHLRENIPDVEQRSAQDLRSRPSGRFTPACENGRSATKSMRTRIILLTVFTLCGRFVSAEDPSYLAEHLSHCITWELAIYKSGFAHEKLSDTCFESPKSYSKLHRISASQLASLQKALSQARFGELPRSIDPTSYQSEEDWFVITVYTAYSGPTRPAFRS